MSFEAILCALWFLEVVLNTFSFFLALMKCEICGSKMTETFLEKAVGTVVKDAKGKKHWVCAGCQSSLKNKDALLAKL